MFPFIATFVFLLSIFNQFSDIILISFKSNSCNLCSFFFVEDLKRIIAFVQDKCNLL